jgi:hypothetical protein
MNRRRIGVDEAFLMATRKNIQLWKFFPDRVSLPVRQFLFAEGSPRGRLEACRYSRVDAGYWALYRFSGPDVTEWMPNTVKIELEDWYVAELPSTGEKKAS